MRECQIILIFDNFLINCIRESFTAFCHDKYIYVSARLLCLLFEISCQTQGEYSSMIDRMEHRATDLIIVLVYRKKTDSKSNALVSNIHTHKIEYSLSVKWFG